MAIRLGGRVQGGTIRWMSSCMEASVGNVNSQPGQLAVGELLLTAVDQARLIGMTLANHPIITLRYRYNQYKKRNDCMHVSSTSLLLVWNMTTDKVDQSLGIE